MTAATPERRTGYTQFAAKVLRDMFLAAELAGAAVNRAVIRHDDDAGPPIELMALTPAGAHLVALLLDAHDCPPSHDDDDIICPVLYLAWVILGCQRVDESADDALGRTEFRVRGQA